MTDPSARQQHVADLLFRLTDQRPGLTINQRLAGCEEIAAAILGERERGQAIPGFDCPHGYNAARGDICFACVQAAQIQQPTPPPASAAEPDDSPRTCVWEREASRLKNRATAAERLAQERTEQRDRCQASFEAAEDRAVAAERALAEAQAELDSIATERAEELAKWYADKAAEDRLCESIAGTDELRDYCKSEAERSEATATALRCLAAFADKFYELAGQYGALDQGVEEPALDYIAGMLAERDRLAREVEELRQQLQRAEAAWDSRERQP